MELRDYQQEMLRRLTKAWRKHRSVMVQMPTGTGKTVLMAETIRQCRTCGNARVLVVAHRRELIEQIRETLAAFGIVDEAVRVESIQKLARRPHPCPSPDRGGECLTDGEAMKGGEVLKGGECLTEWEPELVVIDEAHHALARTYRMLWDRWPRARFLGLTATPCRLSGEPFTDLFDELLQSYTIQEFIDRGWLSDFEYVSARPDSLMLRQVRTLRKRGADGDYQTKEMATVMDVPESIEHLYATYRAFAGGRQGIVYAIDRQHAGHIADYYHEQGVSCAVIDSKTPARERQQLVDDYRRQALDVLVNVDIFGEGFDVPEVEFIQLARPTLSLSKYLQQVGRGMRISPGKAQVLILDNVGLYQQFGLPTVSRDWRQLFYGREPGRGTQDLTRCVVVDEKDDADAQQRELVNLEMVRIKARGQRGAGLEVFLQDGRYGVMRNGQVTCPAMFKRVKRLQGESGFFAYGVYLMRNEQNFGKLEEVTTIIDKKGQDLHIKLYGVVTWKDGYFCGIKELGRSTYVNCWDPVGNSYYYGTYPDFLMIGGVEVAWADEHLANKYPCRKLRYSTGRVSPRFDEWEMFYNQSIVIARDYLIVKKDRNHSYRISGYLDDSILVESEEGYGYQQIFPNGKKGLLFKRMPEGSTRIMNVSSLGVQRVVS